MGAPILKKKGIWWEDAFLGSGTLPHQLGPVALSWWLKITKLKPNSCWSLGSAHAPAFLLYLDLDLFIFPPHPGWEGDGAEPGLVMLPPACWRQGEDPAAPARFKSIFLRMISHPNILLGLQLHPRVLLALFCISFLLYQSGFGHLAGIGQLSPLPIPWDAFYYWDAPTPHSSFAVTNDAK